MVTQNSDTGLLCNISSFIVSSAQRTLGPKLESSIRCSLNEIRLSLTPICSLLSGERTMKSSTWWYTLAAITLCVVRTAVSGEEAQTPAERRISVSQYYDQNDNGEVNKNKLRQEASAHYQRQHDELAVSSQDEEDSLSNYRNSPPQFAKHDTIAVGSVEDADISGIRNRPQFVRGSVVSPEEPGEEAQESINTGTYNHRVPQYIHASPAHDLALDNDPSTIKNRPVSNYLPNYSSQNSNHYSPSDFIQDPSYQLDFKYHDYDKLTKFLRTTSSKYPNLTALYSIGKSIQGKQIRVASGIEEMLHVFKEF